jgi:non-specific serine/threonine protein kinase/serine/threonine-protein kinase
MTEIDTTWRRMWELFHAALDLDPAARRAFLDETCGDDESLRTEVAQLLDAHDGGAEALDHGAVRALGELADDEAAPLHSGQRIGPYVIQGVLGQGGFAVVYLAEQTEPIQRQVALKIVKLGMDTTRVLARFRAEQQALAVMDHSHIAKVFDAGITDGGRPYFVMERVQGVPITEYCDRHQLGTTPRLRLFQDVCHAVQHAHQKGIIHRDLKPSNVLVGGSEDRPVVKVIDFGIAKAIDEQPSRRTLFTEQGHLVGTPQYMSPEQADPGGVDVDTRTDIYSLGVVLYELMTGTTPIDLDTLRSAGLAGMQRLIREKEPPRPSTRLSTLGGGLADVARTRGADPQALARSVRGDLDWIVMKALEKDRVRRYGTANALAMDIDRHLHDNPVLAGPPGAMYRLRKFVRRHRIGVAAGTIVVTALLASLAFAAVGLVMATRDRDRLQAALETATRQTRIAEAVNAFLERDLLAQADPLNTADRHTTVAELLDRTSVRIEGAFPGEPLVEASIRTTLGVTYRGLGEYEAAVRHLEAALRIRRSELGDDHSVTLETMLPLAWSYWYLSRYDQAEALWVDALPISRRHLGEDHPDTLQAMAGLAALYNYQHRFEEARPLHMETVARCRTVLGEEHHDTLTAMHNLAWLDQQQGHTREAEHRFAKVLEIRRRVLGEEHPHTLSSLTSLAGCYRAQGRYTEAEASQFSALATSRRVLGDEHPATLRRMTELAELYDTQRRDDLAEPLLVESLARQRDLLGDDHRDTQYTVNVLAAHCLVQGRSVEAERLFAELVERQQRLFGEEAPVVRNSLGWLARAQTQVLAGHEAELGSTHRRTLRDLRDLVVTLIRQGKLEEADVLAIEYNRRLGRISGTDVADQVDAAALREAIYEAWRREER